MTIPEFALVKIRDGIYSDPAEPLITLLHVGEILVSRGITDTQEARAAIYAETVKIYKSSGIEVILIQEDGVPSIKELANKRYGPLG